MKVCQKFVNLSSFLSLPNAKKNSLSRDPIFHVQDGMLSQENIY